LIAAIVDFLATDDLLRLDDVRAELECEIDAEGPSAVLALKERLAADHGWDYYESDPLARRIHHLLADRFLRPESCVRGIEHVDDLRDAPALFFANHLSYADANVIEVLLHRSGAHWLTDRLTALAGPKVFANRQRRFSSLCFGTIKVPQSSDVSSDEAVLNLREVARSARQSIGAARERLVAGDALLLFGEGARSRTGSMRPMLAGVSRYLAPGSWIVPTALTGSEVLFPVGGTRLTPARVTLTIGPRLATDALLAEANGDRRRAVDAIGGAIAMLLPPEYRGVYR
jgi:1-acyl-sn-glycerol-3-phosphate acyltransferase